MRKAEPVCGDLVYNPVTCNYGIVVAVNKYEVKHLMCVNKGECELVDYSYAIGSTRSYNSNLYLLHRM